MKQKKQEKDISAQPKSITINGAALSAKSVLKNLRMKRDESLPWKDHMKIQ